VPDGLFWTVLVPDSSVRVDLTAGNAVMAVRNLPTLDFVTFVNDAQHGPSIPTTVSFFMQWSGLSNRSLVRIPVLSDGSPGFIASLAQSETGGASVSFTASEPTAVVNGVTGAVYSSDPTTPATVLYAALGAERNGVFFQG
jgi:hypothetical protein